MLLHSIEMNILPPQPPEGSLQRADVVRNRVRGLLLGDSEQHRVAETHISRPSRPLREGGSASHKLHAS